MIVYLLQLEVMVLDDITFEVSSDLQFPICEHCVGLGTSSAGSSKIHSWDLAKLKSDRDPIESARIEFSEKALPRGCDNLYSIS